MPRPVVLSVVVPTHNRAAYAIECMRSVLALDADDLQLVISDTSVDETLAKLVESAGFAHDSRLKYVKRDGPSSLTENHNAAIGLADGEYICLIGDDDTITEQALLAARWAGANDVEIVSQTLSANYAWPDFRSRSVGTGHAGRLYLPRTIGGAEVRKSADALHSGLRNAFQGSANMPRCYHGIVRRDVLDHVKSLSGEYFQGSSPDQSGAVSLACVTSSYFEVDIPLTIPGAAGQSNSGRSAMNTHKGRLESETQTQSFSSGGWTPGVPKFFSVETVWAHAGLETLMRVDPEKLRQYNFARLLALCKLRHGRGFPAEIATAMREYAELADQSLLATKLEIGVSLVRVAFERLRYYAWRLTRPTVSGGRKYKSGLADICAAGEELREYLVDRRWSFEQVIAQPAGARRSRDRAVG